MSIWLILSPLLVWLVAGTWGLTLIKRSADRIWKSYFPTRTTPPAYDGSVGQRFLVALSRMIGWLLMVAAIFVTIMALLVAVGVVSPAMH